MSCILKINNIYSDMTDVDKKYLNAYHKDVYDKVSPYLNEEEKEWLAKYTRAI